MRNGIQREPTAVTRSRVAEMIGHEAMGGFMRRDRQYDDDGYAENDDGVHRLSMNLKFSCQYTKY